MSSKQVRLYESSILRVISEVVSSYIKEGDIDNPAYSDYDYSDHIDNPSQEQKDADNAWSEENAFETRRNSGTDDYDTWMELRTSLPSTHTAMDAEAIKDKELPWYPDENRNITDTNDGRLSILAQSEYDDDFRGYARRWRPTWRQTIYNDENESVLDEIVTETIRRFFKKKNK